MNIPKVSILLQCYNQGAFLDESISSLLFQTYTSFEIIAINDHSTDNTQAVLERYRSKYPHIIKIASPHKRLGPIASYKYGVDLAKGKYLAWMCADNAWYPCYLSSLVPLLEAGHDFVYGQHEIWSEDLKNKIYLSEKTCFPYNFEDVFCGKFRKWNAHAFTLAFLYRKHIHQKVQVTHAFCDENTFASACARNFFRFKGIKKPILKIRSHILRKIDNHTNENEERTVKVNQYALKRTRNWVTTNLPTLTQGRIKTLFPELKNVNTASYNKFLFNIYFRQYNLEMCQKYLSKIPEAVCPALPSLAELMMSKYQAADIPYFYFFLAEDSRLTALQKQYFKTIFTLQYPYFYPEKIQLIYQEAAESLSYIYIEEPAFALELPFFLEYINQNISPNSLIYFSFALEMIKDAPVQSHFIVKILLDHYRQHPTYYPLLNKAYTAIITKD